MENVYGMKKRYQKGCVLPGFGVTDNEKFANTP